MVNGGISAIKVGINIMNERAFLPLIEKKKNKLKSDPEGISLNVTA